MSNDDILYLVEKQTGMIRTQFGSVSINTADSESYRAIVFNIGKTQKGMAREKKTPNMSFEDAMSVFRAVEVQIKQNRSNINKVVSIKSLVESVKIVEESGLKVKQYETVMEEGLAYDNAVPEWLR